MDQGLELKNYETNEHVIDLAWYGFGNSKKK